MTTPPMSTWAHLPQGKSQCLPERRLSRQILDWGGKTQMGLNKSVTCPPKNGIQICMLRHSGLMCWDLFPLPRNKTRNAGNITHVTQVETNGKKAYDTRNYQSAACILCRSMWHLPNWQPTFFPLSVGQLFIISWVQSIAWYLKMVRRPTRSTLNQWDWQRMLTCKSGIA